MNESKRRMRNETAAANALRELKHERAASERRARDAATSHDWNPLTRSCHRCGLTERDFANEPRGVSCPPPESWTPPHHAPPGVPPKQPDLPRTRTPFAPA